MAIINHVISTFTLSTNYAQLLQRLPNSRRCELFLDHAFNFWKIKNPDLDNLGPQFRDELGGLLQVCEQKVESAFYLLLAHDRFKNKPITMLLKNVDFLLGLVCNIFYFSIPITIPENDPSQKINGYEVMLGGNELYGKAIVFGLFQMILFEWRGIKYHILDIGKTIIIIVLDGNWLFNKTFTVLNHICQWRELFYLSSRIIILKSNNEMNLFQNLCLSKSFLT